MALMNLFFTLILITQGSLADEGGVLCFNCVSTQVTGCGLHADFQALVKTWLAGQQDSYESLVKQLEPNISHVNVTRSSPRASVTSWTDDFRREVVTRCPGNNCLVQRQIIASGTGDVYVRTCDVSQVPVGQCHLVSGVLGSKLSVVCVCSGNLCNGHTSSGPSICVTIWFLHVIGVLVVLVMTV